MYHCVHYVGIKFGYIIIVGEAGMYSLEDCTIRSTGKTMKKVYIIISRNIL